MSVVPEIERLQFPDHFWSALLAPGERRKVVDISIEGSGGYTGFVERIACDFFGNAPDGTCTLHEFIIDGFVRSFQYEIEINKPYTYDPPIVARKNIQWYVTNNDTVSHYYGIMIDGFLAKPKV
jgi:hypothetical protein